MDDEDAEKARREEELAAYRIAFEGQRDDEPEEEAPDEDTVELTPASDSETEPPPSIDRVPSDAPAPPMPERPEAAKWWQSKALWTIGGSSVAGLAVVSCAVFGLIRACAPEPPPPGRTTTVPVAKPAHPATTTPAGGGIVDSALKATLSADPGTCKSGSTPPSYATDGDQTHAFICVRGGEIGQVFTVNLGQASKAVAISLVPCAVGAGSDGQPQWREHRVLIHAHAVFPPDPNAPEGTTQARVVDIRTPGTCAPVVTAIDPPQLATSFKLVILETGPPPPDADPNPATSDDSETSPLGAPSDLGPAPTPTTDGDSPSNLSDSFGFSALIVEGHPPQ